MQDTEGARGFDGQIRTKGECVSARALVHEMLSSSKVGCMSVAHSQVASNRGRQRYCTLALWGPWYQGPKQRTQSHTTAVPLFGDSQRLAVVAEVVVGAVLREEGGLTHLATRDEQTATARRVHWRRGAWMGFAAAGCCVGQASKFGRGRRSKVRLWWHRFVDTRGGSATFCEDAAAAASWCAGAERERGLECSVRRGWRMVLGVEYGADRRCMAGGGSRVGCGPGPGVFLSKSRQAE